MEGIRQVVYPGKSKPTLEKGLFGYKKKEVMETISSLTEENLRTEENYKASMEEQARALAMALREKEKLEATVADLEAKIKTLTPEGEEEHQSMLAENAEMKARLNEMKSCYDENANLKKQLAEIGAARSFTDDDYEKLRAEADANLLALNEQAKANCELERRLNAQISALTGDADYGKSLRSLTVRRMKAELDKITALLSDIEKQ